MCYELMEVRLVLFGERLLVSSLMDGITATDEVQDRASYDPGEDAVKS